MTEKEKMVELLELRVAHGHNNGDLQSVVLSKGVVIGILKLLKDSQQSEPPPDDELVEKILNICSSCYLKAKRKFTFGGFSKIEEQAKAELRTLLQSRQGTEEELKFIDGEILKEQSYIDTLEDGMIEKKEDYIRITILKKIRQKLSGGTG